MAIALSQFNALSSRISVESANVCGPLMRAEHLVPGNCRRPLFRAIACRGFLRPGNR